MEASLMFSHIIVTHAQKSLELVQVSHNIFEEFIDALDDIFLHKTTNIKS